MKLRAWQSDCINHALETFLVKHSHFLCLATPGAGKTTMASVLANRLFKDNLIDLVLCFSPSTIVAHDFRNELELQTGKRFNGGLGASGTSLTYQSMANIKEEFWNLLKQYRVFVIFDEIHHCAGMDMEQANVWGQNIITNIQGQACFTLALTGTPWRSDSIPISLSKYSEHEKKIHCDYRYGLKRAIEDGVCRRPNITVIDNDSIKVNSGIEHFEYSSIEHFIQDSICSYKELIEHPIFLSFMLEYANEKLNRVRVNKPNAGGVIVTASVEHAFLVKTLLNILGEDSVIATYREDDAISIIKAFKHNDSKWIISVGMISEGTNIPRLQVCCYVSQVKTELYFRQVLGRVLRVDKDEMEQGHFIMPAEPKLLEYAERVGEDIPFHDVVNHEKARAIEMEPAKVLIDVPMPEFNDIHEPPSNSIEVGTAISASLQSFTTIEEFYESSINSFGEFKTEIIAL